LLGRRSTCTAITLNAHRVHHPHADRSRRQSDRAVGRMIQLTRSLRLPCVPSSARRNGSPCSAVGRGLDAVRACDTPRALDQAHQEVSIDFGVCQRLQVHTRCRASHRAWRVSGLGLTHRGDWSSATSVADFAVGPRRCTSSGNTQLPATSARHQPLNAHAGTMHFVASQQRPIFPSALGTGARGRTGPVGAVDYPHWTVITGQRLWQLAQTAYAAPSRR